MAIIKPEFTPEQADICKAALVAVPLKGNLGEMVEVIGKIHATIKAIEDAVEAAKKAEAPTPPPDIPVA